MTLFTTRAARLAVFFVLVAGGLLVRWFEQPESDIAGNVLFAQMVLEGARPHVDLHDVNPPLAFHLYVPAVLIETLTGLRAETAAHLLTTALIIGSVLLGEAVLRDEREDATVRALRVALLLIMMVWMPTRTFSQRDHIAFILVWPLLAAFMRRSEGKPVPFAAACAAGLLAPVGLALKPHLVLGPAFAFLIVLLRRRDLRPVASPEVAGAVVSGLALVVQMFIAHRAYLTETLPIALEVYGPIKPPLYLMRGAAIVGLVGVTILVARRDRGPRGIMAAAGAGFALAYLLAGKGWPYQAVPALTAGLLALLLPIWGERPDKGLLLASTGLTAAAAAFASWTPAQDAPFTDIVRRTAPPNPVVGHLSFSMSIQHPLIRTIGGTLANPSLLLWKTWGAEYGLARTADPERIARLEAHRRAEAAELAAAWARRPPDLIFVQTGYDWTAWASANERLAHLLARYEPAGEGERAMLLRRRADPDAAVRP